MAPSVAENPGDKGCKGSLNGTANPSERLIDGDQFFLGNADEKCRIGANRIALLSRQSMQDNGFSLSTLGSMIGKDATAAHRVLDTDASHPPVALQVLAAVLLLDKSRTWLRGVAALVGCEVSQRPAIDDAEFRRRVEHKARQGKADSAWLEEALEDAP